MAMRRRFTRSKDNHGPAPPLLSLEKHPLLPTAAICQRTQIPNRLSGFLLSNPRLSVFICGKFVSVFALPDHPISESASSALISGYQVNMVPFNAHVAQPPPAVAFLFPYSRLT
jgi:hypothetical protein